MPLIVVCTLKSHGASTTALGLAAALSPRSGAVLVECDAAGGDLAARHRLRLAPGLVELATHAHRNPSGVELVPMFTQQVKVGPSRFGCFMHP